MYCTSLTLDKKSIEKVKCGNVEELVMYMEDKLLNIFLVAYMFHSMLVTQSKGFENRTWNCLLMCKPRIFLTIQMNLISIE